MTDEDDLLAPYDLTAWEAPPPPGGLVDAVIARARVPVAAAAIAPEERAPRRWWWLAGGIVAAVAVVAILIGVWGTRRLPEDGRGIVVAERAEALAIGPTRAALDPGAEVRWERTRRKITASQPRGAVTWTVGKDDTLVIDAGATVASVEATGASLRVEVEMNRADVRAIGVSGATAIAVAAVTVIVYEGHVRVSSHGQTVNVTPGATYQVRPPEAEGFAVGGGPVDPRIAELEAEVARLEAQIAGDEGDAPADKTATSCDEVSCVLTNYAGACCERFKQEPTEQATDPDVAGGLDRAMVQRVMQALEGPILACPRAGFSGTLKLKLKVSPAGAVVRYEAVADGLPPALARCARDVAATATFPATKTGGALSYPYVLEAPAACDADALKEKGDGHLQTGEDAQALVAFEAALRCRSSADLVQRAFMAACRAKNAPKARAYYQRLPASRRQAFSQICLRAGVDPTSNVAPRTPPKAAPKSDDKPPCDAEALKAKGDGHLQTGMDAAALAAFEAAIRCTASPELYQRAFMAACRSKNQVKAKLYYGKLPASRQGPLSAICVRSGIDPR